MSRSGLLVTSAAFLLLLGLVAWYTLRDAGTEGATDRGYHDGDGTVAGKNQAPPKLDERKADAPEAAPQDSTPLEIPSAIVGRVLDPDGRPAEGVEVYPAPADAAAVLRAVTKTLVRTDDKGAFRLLLPPGRTDLIAWRSGLRPGILQDLDVPSGENVDVGEIRLPAGLAIRGRVVDEGGAAVAEARVTAWREEGLRSPALLPARLGIPAWGGTADTPESGEFAITGLGPGQFKLAAQGLGIRMTTDPVEASAGDTDVTIVVKRLRIATGRVVDEATEKPVEEATVTLTVKTPRWRQTFMYRTLPDGRFAFDLSDERYSGEVTLSFQATGKGFEDGSWDSLTLDATAPAAKLLLPLVAAIPVEPGKLKGRMVYDTGDPFSGGVLTLSFSKTEGGASVHRVRTNENGEFLIEEVPAGEYTLRTAPGNSTLLRETGKRLVIPPGGEEFVELTMVRGGDVILDVRIHTGEPAESAVVHVLSEEGEVLYSIPVEKGTAGVGDLSPGSARLRVTAPGHAAKAVSAEVVKSQQTRLSVTLEEAR